jgi:hypothetical protein
MEPIWLQNRDLIRRLKKIFFLMGLLGPMGSLVHSGSLQHFGFKIAI